MTKEQLAYMAKSRLWVFPKLASSWQCPNHLVFAATKLQDAIKRQNEGQKKKQLLIFRGPPRHGKSEMFPVHSPPWILGNWPKKRIIISAYAAKLAEKHSARGKDLFEKWGPILWDTKPSAKVFNRSTWDTDQGGGVLSVGVDGGATGFGSDIFFIDDYHPSRKEAESTTYREAVWNWWQSVVLMRLHPGAIVVIFATAWHEDDLIGRLLAQYKDKGKDKFPFELHDIKMPAIAEEDDALGREPGEALWPWWVGTQELEDMKNAVGSYEWAALFQCRPTSRGGNLFKSDNFRYYTIDPQTSDYLCWRKNIEKPIRIRKNELVRHVYCDPSLEIKTTNDPTGAGAWGYSKKHKIWLLLDRLNDRIEHTQVMDAIKLFAFKNRCTIIGIENEKLGKVLVKQSAGNDSVGGVKIPFKEIPTGGLDKYARATAMAAYYENERVFIFRDAPYRADYEDNLVKFPNAKHDEDVDVTSMADAMEGQSSLAEVLARR